MNNCEINCMCYECIKSHHENGCSYGRPEIDDVCKECDCDFEE